MSHRPESVALLYDIFLPVGAFFVEPCLAKHGEQLKNMPKSASVRYVVDLWYNMLHDKSKPVKSGPQWSLVFVMLNTVDCGEVWCLTRAVADTQPVNIGGATSDIDSTLPYTVSDVLRPVQSDVTELN